MEEITLDIAYSLSTIKLFLVLIMINITMFGCVIAITVGQINRKLKDKDN